MDFQTKYNLKSFDQIPDERLRILAQRYTTGKSMEPLLLHGVPGTGKTAFARLLANNLCDDISDGDILSINASAKSGIDTARNTISDFASCIRLNSQNIGAIIIDEADGFSRDAQNALKGEMDKWRQSNLFILTTNHVDDINSAIRDRCETVLVNRPKPDELLPMAQNILAEENESVPEEKLLALLEADCANIMGLSYRAFFRRLTELVEERRRLRDNKAA